MKIREQLLQKFSDFVYRHAYVDDFLDASIATQIKVLREQRNLRQHTFAQKLNMRQSQVARMESANHSGWQIRTLKKVAKALDVCLVVKFESFGAVLPDIEGFGRASLERPSFKDDPVFRAEAVPAVTVTGRDEQTTIRQQITINGGNATFYADVVCARIA